MIYRFPALYMGIILLTAVLVASGIIFPGFWGVRAWIPAILLIVLVGIPHGAADHLIFARLSKERWGRSRWLYFFVTYLGLMGLYGVLWWQFPILSLLLFLLISAYHFGQANWSFLQVEQKSVQVIIGTIWGIWALFTPLLLQFDAASAIIVQIAGEAPLIPGNKLIWAAMLFGINLLVILALWMTGLLQRKEFFREGLHLVLLELLFFNLPLLLSFAVFFTLWHSLGSMQDQVAFFSDKAKGYRWKNYIKQILPMTFLALLGLAGFIWWQHSSLLEGNLGALFVFISILTLPHMVLMEYLYEYLNKNW